MDGLAALVQQALRADPFAGDVFIFRPKRADYRQKEAQRRAAFPAIQPRGRPFRNGAAFHPPARRVLQNFAAQRPQTPHRGGQILASGRALHIPTPGKRAEDQ